MNFVDFSNSLPTLSDAELEQHINDLSDEMDNPQMQCDTPLFFETAMAEHERRNNSPCCPLPGKH